MAVYRSKAQTVTDDLKIEVNQLSNWKTSLQEHLRQVASLKTTTSTDTTATSEHSKVSLIDAYITQLTHNDHITCKY